MHVMVHKTPSLRWLTSTGWVASYLTNAKRGGLVSGMLLRWELYSFQSLSYLLGGDILYLCRFCLLDLWLEEDFVKFIQRWRRILWGGFFSALKSGFLAGGLQGMKYSICS